MVIDGLDSEVEACRWQEWGLPTPARRGAGSVIITTKNRELLQDFTHFDENTTIAVNTLEERDAFKIFVQEVGEDSIHVTAGQDYFKMLWEILGIPLFVILAAHYLKKHIFGHATLQRLTARLQDDVPNFKCLDKRPQTAGKVQEVEIMQYRIFCVLLDPFVDQYKPDTDEFGLQATLCCMASDDLDVDMISSFYEDSDPIEEWLGTLGNYRYITPQGNGGKFTMHDLVHKFFFRYVFEHPDLGPKYLLGELGEVLKCIFFRSQQYRPEKSWTANSGTPQHASHGKRRFMPHFEVFNDFVKVLNKQKLTTGTLAAEGVRLGAREVQGIISFSRVLHTDNNTNEAIALLEFALNQGVEPHRIPKKEIEVEIELHRSIAYYHLEQHSVEMEKFNLNQAKIHFEAALQLAREHGLHKKIWRTWIGLIEAMVSLHLLEEADAQIDLLESYMTDSNSHLTDQDNERTEFSSRVDVQKVLIEFEKAKRDQKHGLFTSAGNRLLSARLMCAQAVVRTHQAPPDGARREELTFEKLRKLAEIDMEIPHPFPLCEAEAIYEAHLRRRERQFTTTSSSAGNGVDISSRTSEPIRRDALVHLARARSNLAMVWLRMGWLCTALMEPEAVARAHCKRARDAMEPTVHEMGEMCGFNDGLAQSMAYSLREMLHDLGLREECRLLETRFGLLPSEDLERPPWFQRGAGIHAGIRPASWTTPLLVHDFPNESPQVVGSQEMVLSLRLFYDEPQLPRLHGAKHLDRRSVNLATI